MGKEIHVHPNMDYIQTYIMLYYKWYEKVDTE